MELSVSFFFYCTFFHPKFFQYMYKNCHNNKCKRDLNFSYKEDQLIPLSYKFHTKFTVLALFSCANQSNPPLFLLFISPVLPQTQKFTTFSHLIHIGSPQHKNTCIR